MNASPETSQRISPTVPVETWRTKPNPQHHNEDLLALVLPIPLWLLASGLWLLLTSCASQPNSAASAQPVIKPGLILVTPDQAEHHGLAAKSPDSSLPAEARGRDSSTVLASPEVRAFSVGRYTDPADPDVLHEAHVVYRRESSPRWRLDAPPSNQILIGPRATDQRPGSGSLQNKELDALLIELRKSNAENRQAIELLFKAVEALTRQQQQVQAGPSATAVKDP